MHFSKHSTIRRFRLFCGFSTLLAAQLALFSLNCGDSQSDGTGGGAVATSGSGGEGGLLLNVSTGSTTGGPSQTQPDVSKEIDSQGGTINGPDGVVMTIPKGALKEAKTITITKIASQPSLPGNFESVGPSYEFGPDGLTFDTAISFDAAIPGAEKDNKGSLVFFSIDSKGVAEQVQGQVEGERYKASLKHFSSGQLAKPKSSPNTTGGAGGSSPSTTGGAGGGKPTTSSGSATGSSASSSSGG